MDNIDVNHITGGDNPMVAQAQGKAHSNGVDIESREAVQDGNNKNSSIRAYNVSRYMHDQMYDDIQKFREQGTLKTGYENLDIITSLYPGLYALGAISSLGKTTWALQLSSQVAGDGNKVIYFAIEQGVLELTAKSLSRIMSVNQYANPLNSLQVRNSEDYTIINQAIEAYDATAKNIDIVECTFRATIDDIEQYIRSFIGKTGEKPIVVIDYLQQIYCSEVKMNNRDIVDMHVRRLKQLQDEYKLVMIVISSLNRQNYLTPIDFESFKESGGIEYTADVVWGLQLEAIHADIFNSQAKIGEKRETIRQAKAENPRKVELICLKNRYGKSSYSCNFLYYPEFDRFNPVRNNGKKNENGFVKVPPEVEKELKFED